MMVSYFILCACSVPTFFKQPETSCLLRMSRSRDFAPGAHFVAINFIERPKSPRGRVKIRITKEHES